MPDLRRVLVIEDDALVASCLCELLHDLEYAVIGPASTGPEALSLAELHRPDIAIVDIRLNGEMDGIDVARAFDERFGIAVIFLSGSCDETVMTRAQGVRPVRFLRKPVRVSALFGAIECALDVQAARPGSQGQKPTRASDESSHAGETGCSGRRRGDDPRIRRTEITVTGD